MAFNGHFVVCQAPALQWQTSLGGTQIDVGVSVDFCMDGGYITASQTNSNNLDVLGNHGGYDIWVVKLSPSGTVEWKRCLGGTGDEYIGSIKQTNDGGYILLGSTSSNDGDVSDNHGQSDLWVVKLNAAGFTTWQRTIGGSDTESAGVIEQAADGGYFLAGSSYSNDGDASGSHGNLDMWVLRLDSVGEILWQRMLGSSGYDALSGMCITSVNGCIIIGTVGEVTDGDVSLAYGGTDIWVAQLDSVGIVEWENTYGGSDNDFGQSIALASNGNYGLAGATASMDYDVSVNHGFADFWVVNVNATGEIQWESTFGGSGDDQAVGICKSSDGGFSLVGYTGSTDGQVTGYHGGYNDAWVIKVNSTGELVWEKTIGGSSLDRLLSIQPTSDGGFAMVGFSNSTDGDLTTNHGDNDMWFVKLGPDFTGIAEQTESISLSVYPNPTAGLVHVASDIKSGAQVNLSVLNATGQVLLSNTLDPGAFHQGTDWKFNAANLPPGVYQLRLLSEGQLYTRQIVRQ